jgi:hypothetical protein
MAISSNKVVITLSPDTIDIIMGAATLLGKYGVIISPECYRLIFSGGLGKSIEKLFSQFNDKRIAERKNIIIYDLSEKLYVIGIRAGYSFIRFDEKKLDQIGKEIINSEMEIAKQSSGLKGSGEISAKKIEKSAKAVAKKVSKTAASKGKKSAKSITKAKVVSKRKRLG